MTVTTDRNGARHDTFGRYAEKPLREAPESTLALSEPDPDGITVEMASALRQLMGGGPTGKPVGMTPAKFRAWVKRDLPGLTDEQRTRFIAHMAELGRAREACLQARAHPDLDDNAGVIFRTVPRRLRDKVARVRSFRRPGEGDHDEDGYSVESDNAEWVSRMLLTANNDIRVAAILARQASDRVKPIKRKLEATSDPWVEHQNDPPPPF